MLEFSLDLFVTFIIFWTLGWAISMLFERNFSTGNFEMLFTGAFVFPVITMINFFEFVYSRFSFAKQK